jgi:hypothetical protein
MHMLKKLTIFDRFAKSKNLFFANIHQSQFESHQVLKLKATSAHCLSKRVRILKQQLLNCYVQTFV